jgi:adenylate kinase family enzyme
VSDARLGRRVLVVGPTNSGKSTLAARIGALLDVPSVDLDALYWKPDWVGSEDEEWHPRLREVAERDAWVVAGNYWRHTTPTLWPRAEAVIWLDLPLRVTLPRIFTRSWKRWRSRELLWGTNREHFFPQFKVWDSTSLVGYALQAHRSMRQRYVASMADPAFAHLRFVRLRSPEEVEAFARAIEAATSR